METPHELQKAYNGRMTRGVLVSAVFALTSMACAVGVNETGVTDEGAGGVLTGVGGGGGALVTSGSSSGGNSTTSSGAGGMAMGGMGGFGGGMGGAGGSGMMCDFSHPETCDTAENLGSVAGDESSAGITITGATSRWVRVHITEEVGSIFEEDLSYRVTLTSAPGMDYDLIIHQGPQDGSPDCNATAKLGVDQGNGVETVSDGWDDDQGIGGEDDSVWLNIEVRHVSGTECDMAAEWTLDIDGHT
jgi:hypothetical protein